MIHIAQHEKELALHAANHAGRSLRQALDQKPSVRLLAATGASQIQFLRLLVQENGIDWDRIELFHLDEYVGISPEHPASFARYIREKVVEPTGITNFHLLDGTDPGRSMKDLNVLFSRQPVDLALVGIGENGHLAFNDPPADFEAEPGYMLVELDEPCRRQQVGEGWFPRLEDVPIKAITLSIPAILSSREILAVVPDERKAAAVKTCLHGPVAPEAPASVLQLHPNTTIYLDRNSASLLVDSVNSTFP